MREERGLDDRFVFQVAAVRFECRESHDDPRSAEATLAGPRVREGPRPSRTEFFVETFERRDVAACDPAGRCNARNAWSAVYPDRAAPALTLGTTTVLYRMQPERFAQDLQQRRSVVRDSDSVAVYDQAEMATQLKEDPQPQVRVAFGFVTWNPAPCSPSL